MSLESDEQVLRQERVHPAIFALPVLAVIGLLAISLPFLFLITSFGRSFGTRLGIIPVIVLAPDVIVGLSLLLITLLAYLHSEVTLTSRRLLYRTGFIIRSAGELPLKNVEGIFIFEPLLGRLFGYGTVMVTTLGGARYPLAFIPKPQILQALLQKAVHAANAPTPPASKSAPLPQDDSRYMPKTGPAQPASPQKLENATRSAPQHAVNPFSKPPQSQQQLLAPDQSSPIPVVACCAVLALLAVPVMLFLRLANQSAPVIPGLSMPTLPPTGIPSASSVGPQMLPSEPPRPTLAEIKAAAEAGDAGAQDKLGDICRSSDNQQALFWYRKAAAQGIPNSQYQLAHLLLSWANSPMAKPEAAAMHSDEAIPWLVRAANHGVKLAQVELGQLYSNGKFLARDVPEAYKWLTLAADGSTVDFGANMGKTYRDNLILKMSQAEIAEGNRRLAAFNGNLANDLPLPEPSFLGDIKLNGITGTAPRALAIINGKTLAAGESATIKVSARSLTIHCLDITPRSAIVSIDGIARSKELYLP